MAAATAPPLVLSLLGAAPTVDALVSAARKRHVAERRSVATHRMHAAYMQPYSRRAELGAEARDEDTAKWFGVKKAPLWGRVKGRGAKEA